MTRAAAPVVRRNPSAEAVLEVLREGYHKGTPWISRSEVARLAGLSPGQAHAALLQLAADGLVGRGVFDDGDHLAVRWRVQSAPRPRGHGLAEALAPIEAAE